MEDVKMMVTFEDVDIQILDREGERWVTAKDLAKALGYANTQKLTNLIDRNLEEFRGREGVLELSTPGGLQQLRVINYHGVIRAAMLARTEKARAFRDWAEEVLFRVMTGQPVSPPVPTTPVQKARADFEALVEIGRIAGTPKHYYLTEAAKAVDERYDVPEVPAIVSKSPAMDAIPDGELMLEPTELAKLYGLRSAQRVNNILADAGLQYRDGNVWTPTDAGKPISAWHHWKNGKLKERPFVFFS